MLVVYYVTLGQPEVSIGWESDGIEIFLYLTVSYQLVFDTDQMGKTHSKTLAARHGRGTAWARHGHGMLCVNRP